MLLELKHIREWYRMEGDERRSMTYSKAMAAIKAYPYPLKGVKEAQGILGVGSKIANLCGEYLKTGKITIAGPTVLLPQRSFSKMLTFRFVRENQD